MIWVLFVIAQTLHAVVSATNSTPSAEVRDKDVSQTPPASHFLLPNADSPGRGHGLAIRGGRIVQVSADPEAQPVSAQAALRLGQHANEAPVEIETVTLLEAASKKHRVAPQGWSPAFDDAPRRCRADTECDATSPTPSTAHGAAGEVAAAAAAPMVAGGPRKPVPTKTKRRKTRVPPYVPATPSRGSQVPGEAGTNVIATTRHPLGPPFRRATPLSMVVPDVGMRPHVGPPPAAMQAAQLFAARLSSAAGGSPMEPGDISGLAGAAGAAARQLALATDSIAEMLQQDDFYVNDQTFIRVGEVGGRDRLPGVIARWDVRHYANRTAEAGVCAIFHRDGGVDMARRRMAERLALLGFEHPQSGEVWNGLGNAWRCEGQALRALQCFLKAEELHGRPDGAIGVNIALVLRHMGFPRDARSTLELTGIGPNDPLALHFWCEFTVELVEMGMEHRSTGDDCTQRLVRETTGEMQTWAQDLRKRLPPAGLFNSRFLLASLALLVLVLALGFAVASLPGSPLAFFLAGFSAGRAQAGAAVSKKQKQKRRQI